MIILYLYFINIITLTIFQNYKFSIYLLSINFKIIIIIRISEVMKEESIQASKITHKHEPKKLVPVMYGQKIHIKNLTLMKEGTYLWGRG